MLKSCSLLPKIFLHDHDPTWSDENGELVTMKQTFMGFLKKFHLTFLVNFLGVWERRFFYLYSSPKFQCLHFWTDKVVTWKRGLVHKPKVAVTECLPWRQNSKETLGNQSNKQMNMKNYETVDSEILFPTSSLWIWLELSIAYWHWYIQFKCLFLLQLKGSTELVTAFWVIPKISLVSALQDIGIKFTWKG